MRTKAAQVTLAAICLIVGLMLVVQFRTQTKIQRSVLSEPATNQAMIISNLYDSNLALRKEVDELSRQLGEFDRSSGFGDLTTMNDDLSRIQVITGLTNVSGTGVELRIDAPLTKEDLQDLINELRNAGAEAIALNDQRIVAQSAVTGDQGALAVNGNVMLGPYSFRAIGQSDTLERALVRKGGVLTIVQSAYPSGTFNVTKQDRMTLPAYRKGYAWTHGKQAN